MMKAKGEAEEDIVTSHYEDLVRTIESISAHHLLVVGDFNARIGSEDAKFPFHVETNRNGRQLLDLASEKDLDISSPYFRKKAGKLWTFISPGGTKYQLDHVLISKCRIVSARVRLSLRKKKAGPRKKQYDWDLFKSRRVIQEQYTIEVFNMFQPLQEQEPDEYATDRYGRFIKATEEAAESVVPVKKRRRKTRHYEDYRVTDGRDELNRAYGTYIKDTTEENRQVYCLAKKKLKETYIAVEEEDLNSKIREVGKAHVNYKHGQSWKLINDITNRKTTRKGKLEGSTQEERIENWYNHFKTLLGDPPSITEEDEEITSV
ncbi:Hypp3574 [Branchiostoma lanceolatum]|uniref:Hypp3574 protein n=1 Tax=Branchiostoma lanceolatum TaxID=7740 RepID=A0A8K0A3B8_BRALA|nr:Hypp3574 [Branchiostoma lanceolatum]